MSLVKKTKSNFISISLLSVIDKIASFVLVIFIFPLAFTFGLLWLQASLLFGAGTVTRSLFY